MRCGRCGNENSEGNRFCGMCGAILVAKTQAPGPKTAAVVPSVDKPAAPASTRASEDARLPAPSARKAVPVVAPPVIPKPVVSPPVSAASISAAPVVTPPAAAPRINRSPIINGPSFLGLDKPGDGRSGDDTQRHGSGHLDYLLEDEGEPKRGWGKLAVVVIALVLIGGFGYLRWKQGGFNFLKPAPAAQSSQGTSDSAGAPGTAATPDAAAPNPANPSPANPNPADQSTASQSPATPDAAASGAGTGASGTASSGTETGAQQATPTSATPAQSTPAENASPGKAQDNTSVEKPTESKSAENSEAEAAKSESHVRAAAAKPSAARTRERKPTPVTPVDPTAEAERYIYGRGVPQDCDHGLHLLKPAAEQSNPKAMIALGTLYSIGTCTPRDLPTAYRWFALALHKQPDNQGLQDDLQKLWSQMTQPERQLAIKLSQ